MANSRYLKNFIEKAKLIHGDTYDYTKSEWNGTSIKITIICKIHGDFQQLATSHIHKKCGCPKCGLLKRSNSQKYTTNEFIERSIEIHGDKYDYSNVIYQDIQTKVEIICKLHGSFLQTPSSHINKKCGCWKCGGTQKYTQNEFLDNAKKVHGDKYDYCCAEYNGCDIPIKIICKIHGEFYQTYAKHVNAKHGCPKCSNQGIWCTSYFIERASHVHNNKYIYDENFDVKNCEISVPIICKIHGVFNQSAISHASGYGCPSCGKGFRCSNTQILWLKWMMVRYNIDIQHYFNGGERRIKITDNKFYYVDGFCASNNTVYEFNGSYFHGEPRLFDLTKINDKLKLSFKKLYQNTIEKEQNLISCGYNVISMWELDFKLILIGIIKIQKKWKSILTKSKKKCNK